MDKINFYQKKGKRCLLLAINTTKYAAVKNQIPEHATPYALIVLEDNIKSQAVETIKLFKENGVDVRVISGDNPITVSEVAKRAGIDNAEKYLSLQNLSDEEIRQQAMDYTVFGRVNPIQKKLLIQCFKEKGRTVAMTGDGVNDILALKEADCSIAMANGSEATRTVAQLVLLDSDFGAIPSIVNEGTVINNVERASSLFLTKTNVLFSFTFILNNSWNETIYRACQLAFTSLFVIGIASFVLALEPNKNQIKGKFIKNIAKAVFPPAISIVGSANYYLLWNTSYLAVSQFEYQTIITRTIFGIFMLVLFNISKPFNVIRAVLFVGIFILAGSIAIIMPYAQSKLKHTSSPAFKAYQRNGHFIRSFLGGKVIKLWIYHKKYEKTPNSKAHKLGNNRVCLCQTVFYMEKYSKIKEKRKGYRFLTIDKLLP